MSFLPEELSDEGFCLEVTAEMTTEVKDGASSKNWEGIGTVERKRKVNHKNPIRRD